MWSVFKANRFGLQGLCENYVFIGLMAYTAITAAVLTAIKILFQNITNLNFFSQLCQLYVSLCSVQVQILCKHLRASGINTMWEPSGWSVFSWYARCAYQVDCTCASRCKAASKENSWSDTTAERTADVNLPQSLNWQVTTVDTSQDFLPSERSALTRCQVQTT